MLLTKVVSVRIMGNVCQYYRRNNINVQYNKVNELPIELLNPQSHLIVDAKCDVCGKQVKIQYRRYNQSLSRGGYYTCSSKCAKDKYKNTMLRNYGVEFGPQSEVVKEKNRKTNLERYGATHFRKSETWMGKNSEREKELRKKTIFDQFMVDNPSVVDQDDKHFLINCEKHGVVPIKKGLFVNRKMNKCELCMLCNPLNPSISGQEVKLFNYIDSIYPGEVIGSYRVNRFELDIYIPNLNLGFEFNGIHWHSDKYSKKDKHIRKTRLFNEQGIKVIHIFEDDYRQRNDIVLGFIIEKLGVGLNVNLNDLEIKKVVNKPKIQEFFQGNYIKGYRNTGIHYGLYDDDGLVALMGVKKNKHHYELVGYCQKIGYEVNGGFEKLFNEFKKEYDPSIVRYNCDLTIDDGELVKGLGFEFVEYQKPKYRYVKQLKTYSPKEINPLDFIKEEGDELLSVNKLMKKYMIPKIYDCGVDVYELKR